MTNNRQDELSLHMRIPADKCFVGNVLLTLDGICDHFCFSEHSRDKIKKALELVINKTVDLFYYKNSGLFDFKFTVYKEKLVVFVEDFLIKQDSSKDVIVNSEKVKNMLKCVENFVDKLDFSEKEGRNSCYSMLFNITLFEEKD